MTAFSQLARPFPQCVRHQCGLQEWAHPALAHPALAHSASSAAIDLLFLTAVSEVTQKRPELKGKVMGLNNEKKREIDTILLVRL